MDITWIVPGFQRNAADYCIPALTDLAHYVAERHNLQIFALQYPNRATKYRVGKIAVQSFGNGKLVRIPHLKRVGPLLSATRAVCQKPGEIIHAFWAAEPALVGVVAARQTHRNLIVSCMGGEAINLPEIGYGAYRHWLDRRYLGLAIKRADVITAGSESLAAILTQKYPGKVKPLVLPLGVDLQRFSPPVRPVETLPAQPLALAVGSLLPVKGHTNLIKAAARLPELRLKIVGEGPECPKLQALITELGLTKRVTLAGAVEPGDMPTEYSKANLFIMSSYYESQCMALLEAMACGLPVVAASVGLAPQLLTNGAAGELAQNNSPDALTQALTRILARRSEWAQLKTAARAEATRFSLETCADNLLTLYEEPLLWRRQLD